MQNGAGDDVKKIVTVLNDAEAPRAPSVSSPPANPRVEEGVVAFVWDRVVLAMIHLGFGFGRRGGGEPAVRVPAAGEGAAAARLRCRRAELLGAQGRRLHRRDQVKLLFKLYPLSFPFRSDA